VARVFPEELHRPIGVAQDGNCHNETRSGEWSSIEGRHYFRYLAASLPDELATSNLLHGAWAGEAKRLAFALGERGIHVNSLSLDKEVARWRGGSFKRAADVETMFEQRQADGASNAPSGEWRRPDEVGIAVEILLSPFSDDMTGLDIQHDSVSSFKYSRRKPTIATGRPQARG